MSKQVEENQGSVFNEACIVIPTRNRADLTPKAIESVLNQADCHVRVIVSDNSTLEEARTSLARYCESLNDSRLTYLRPPEPMHMSRHWDWALQQALDTDSSHFAFLCDRMLFKPDSLKTVIDIVNQFPSSIVSYLHDKVLDFSPPYGVHQYEWSGKLYEVSSQRLLFLSANSVMYDGCCPRMLNCFVPRSVLNVIRMRFGSVFSSIAPDWNFTYRALEVVDSLLYFHKAVLVHYSQQLSNGESAHRGIRNRAYAEFVDELPTPVNIDAPYPEIVTVWNAIISEYCSVKKETNSVKFPELNLAAYAQGLASGIAAIEDPIVRLDMETKLKARGWQVPEKRSFGRKLFSPRTILNSPRTILSKMKLMIRPRFETADQALEYALNRPRPRIKSMPWEAALHEGVEIPIELK
jgi:glycosyl transferase family 2